MEIKEIICKRKSVRTFNGQPLGEEDMQKLRDYVATIDNPFGIDIEFRFLDAKEHDLTSPVIVGTDCYVAAKVERAPLFEIAFGYTFEKFCLYALSLGVGTVMLAGTFSRKTFEQAMELKGNEVMPLASPIGYPSDKRSLRERLMCKAISADKRLEFETLFFDGSFDSSLTPERAGKFREAFEMLRLAPSAVNKQPWRAVVSGNNVHFYENHSKGLENELGDIQKLDMGIALAHFDLTLKEEGHNGSFVVEDPGLSDELEYIITYKTKEN